MPTILSRSCAPDSVKTKDPEQLGGIVDLVMAVGKDEDGNDYKDLVLTGD
jgi:hypothetical protein